MKKRLLSLLLCGAMVLGVLTGCGSADAGQSEGDAEKADKGNGGETVITVWSIATESDAFHPAYMKAIADFEANHAGVKIQFETFENEAYKTKLKSAVAANELPDVFSSWAGGFSKPFVESGKVLPLDSYYEAYADELPKAVLGNVTYDGKIYGSALTTSVSAMFYNKKIFAEHNLEVPKTWDEWKNVCQVLIDAGITPIGVSAKDTWVLAMTHDAMTLKSAGPEKVKKALLGEGQSYDDPDFLSSAQKLKELKDMGAFSESAIGLSNDEASADFYAGKAAMYTTGSWMAGSINTDAENPDDFGVAPIPVLNDANAKITDFMGGASDTLMVSASTKNPDLAAAAAFELTKGVSHYSYLDGAGVPAWKVTYDDSSVNPLTKQVADYATNATSFTLWFDTLMEAEDAGEYLALLQELYVGNITPEEFTKAMAAQLE